MCSIKDDGAENDISPKNTVIQKLVDVEFLYLYM